MRIRTILGFSCAYLGSCSSAALIRRSRNILRKPRPRVAVSPRLCCLCQLAGALPAMAAAVVPCLLSHKVYCRLRSFGVSEPRSHAFLVTELAYAYLQQERHVAALATGNCPLASEDHTKVQKKLVSMRSYCEELSLRTRHGIRGLFAQS